MTGMRGQLDRVLLLCLVKLLVSQCVGAGRLACADGKVGACAVAACLRLPEHLRGGREKVEGKVTKTVRARGDGARTKKSKETKKKTSNRISDAPSTKPDDAVDQALEESSGDGAGVGQGEPAGAQDEGEQGLQVPDGPHHFFGEFAADFPNRGRLDELYKDAQIVQQDEESSTMEGEGSSGDGQASNPFEYYTRKPMADDGMEHDMMSLIKDCAGRQQLKRVCHVHSGDLVRIRCTHCQRTQAVNEVMKSIARNIAEFVVLAADTEPIEIVLQIPVMCEDKGIPFCWVRSREALGLASGLRGASAAVSVLADPRSPLEARVGKMKTRVDMLGIKLAQQLNPVSEVVSEGCVDSEKK